MARFETLIVGAHFRPPAKQLLACLAAGHPLRLEEQNDNEYDAAAVRIMLDLTGPEGQPLLAESQLAMLAMELPNVGLTLEQLMSGGPVQLAFVPAQEGKPLAKARLTEPELLGNQQVREIMGQGGEPDRQYTTTLGFGLDGLPRVILQVED